MAGVPRRAGVGVSTAPLPEVRAPLGVPAGAFGGLPVGPDLTGVQNAATELAQNAWRKAENTAVLDADNKLATFTGDQLNAIGQRKGTDAFTADGDFRDAWQKQISQIEQGLTTEGARERFHRLAADRYLSADDRIQAHIAQQRDAYTTEVFRTGLETAYDAAVSAPDPAGRDAAIAKTKASLAEYGAQMGWGAELTAQKQAAAVSRIHAGVIDQLIANKQDLAAADYLTAHHTEIGGQDLIQAERLVTTGSVLGAAQRAADGIVKSTTTLTDALAAAGQILNPQVREETEQRVRRTFEDRAQADREGQNAAMIQGGKIVREKGFEAVPAKILNGLTPIQVRDLKLLDESLRRRPSDPETVNRLRNMSGLDPAGFSRLNLADYHDQLSDSDLRSLQSTQRTIRLGTARTEGATRTRLGKELTKLRTEVGAANALGGSAIIDAALAPKKARIKQIEDSLKVGGATPPAPGAPLPTTTRTPAPAAGGKKAAPAGALPTLQLPGGKTPDDDAAGQVASVPADWLAHAQENPDYAAYLASMGVHLE